jgi:hypothetical protein
MVDDQQPLPGGHSHDDEQFDWSWTQVSSDWVPPVMDTSRPSSARMYDYYLGGKDNFPVDREAAQRVYEAAPGGDVVAQVARANRAFLVRAVDYLVGQGVTQFLDLGTGIPTSPSVHEVARKTDPHARVVYVDHDPIVLTHNRALLATDEGVTTVLRDLRAPDKVLNDPEVTAVIDFDRPVGLLMIAVLHFVEPALAAAVVRNYTRALAAGSHLAVSVATREGVDPAAIASAEAVYRNTDTPIYFRTRAQAEELLDGLTLIDPGLVQVSHWRGSDPPAAPGILAGIAKKA